MIQENDSMAYKTFDEIIARLGNSPRRARLAVAAAADEHTLQAVLRAKDEGLVEPVLVGDAGKIGQICRDNGRDEARVILNGSETAEPVTGSGADQLLIYHVPDIAEACARAVALIHEGKADFLMKGATDTRIYLKAVVDKANGLGQGRLMSHVNLIEIPGYHKIVLLTDMAMLPYPTLEQKAGLIRNAAEVLGKFGYAKVKVAALTCVEKVNPRMPETVEAAELAKMAEEGQLPDAAGLPQVVVAGPISYDCAMSLEVAETKGYDHEVAGDTDILLCPDIHAANILGKCLQHTCGAKEAGFIYGTKCPVILTSRGASADEKYYSIVMAALAAFEAGASEALPKHRTNVP